MTTTHYYLLLLTTTYYHLPLRTTTYGPAALFRRMAVGVVVTSLETSFLLYVQTIFATPRNLILTTQTFCHNPSRPHRYRTYYPNFFSQPLANATELVLGTSLVLHERFSQLLSNNTVQTLVKPIQPRSSVS